MQVTKKEFAAMMILESLDSLTYWTEMAEVVCMDSTHAEIDEVSRHIERIVRPFNKRLEAITGGLTPHDA